MSYDRSRQSRRPLYAPPSRSTGRNHSVLGYWVPLLVTGTIAIGGIAAWVWSERSEHDEDDYPPGKPQRPPTTGSGAPYSGPQSQQGGVGTELPPYQGPIPSQSGGPQGGPPPGPTPGGEAASYYAGRERGQEHDEGYYEDEQGGGQTFYGQVRGALRRTPSPQQFFDQASRQVTAGIAAAGSALGSIMEDPDNGHGPERGHREESEERREGFSDHERWSEEAEDQRERRVVGMAEGESETRVEGARSGKNNKGRRSVAVVVSADTNMDGKMDEEDVVYTEHASILSHLPAVHNPSQTDLFVLIYAPGLTRLPPLDYKPQHLSLTSTLGSSYSALNTPGSEHSESNIPRHDDEKEQDTDFPSPSRQFDALYTQALTLVSHPSQILCFTTIEGYVPMLRHLAPNLAYVSDLLAGEKGAAVEQLGGWVGHTMVVVGDDGTGGLADTETEDEETGKEKGKREWWEESAFVGLGKPVEIVDAARVGDDWGKRVGGRE